MLFRLCLVCSASLVVAPGCGRLGFDATSEASLPVDGAIEAPTGRITYVAPFVARDGDSGAVDVFDARARGAGDAIVIQVACSSPVHPTAVAVTAPGWTFEQRGPITASAASNEHAATFVAIAPDTVATKVTIAWTGSTCNIGKNHLGDEFGIEPVGGAISVDAVAATEGKGNCLGSVRSNHAGEAVWAACDSANAVHAVGAGFTKGADDGIGDWSEYRLTDDPAGTLQSVELDNDNVGYVLSIVTIRPGA